MYAESKYYGIYRSIVYYRSIKRENLKFFAGREFESLQRHYQIN